MGLYQMPFLCSNPDVQINSAPTSNRLKAQMINGFQKGGRYSFSFVRSYDDPPVPAELHPKPPAAGLTDVADPLSSRELSSIFGPPVENVPRLCPGTDSYADALKMKKEDELTVHRPNLFLEVPVDTSRFQYR
ncbi:hypothetical protein J6590_009840 [Homalodisca vitripennis]|nr:hypothetical protein J6590_009840 [Homalodisca vitripennis]